jgi:CheY-like chemotaxis protein
MPARILVIEDNPESLTLMTFLLTAFGHMALKAADAEEGLQLAVSERPDLILCDLQMSELDGYEVARQIRRDPQLSSMPLVAVTASAMRADREKVMAAGFNGYITKPIVPEEFVSRTEEFLRLDLRSVTRRPNQCPPAAAVSTQPKQYRRCDPRSG